MIVRPISIWLDSPMERKRRWGGYFMTHYVNITVFFSQVASVHWKIEICEMTSKKLIESIHNYQPEETHFWYIVNYSPKLDSALLHKKNQIYGIHQGRIKNLIEFSSSAIRKPLVKAHYSIFLVGSIEKYDFFSFSWTGSKFFFWKGRCYFLLPEIKSKGSKNSEDTEILLKTNSLVVNLKNDLMKLDTL